MDTIIVDFDIVEAVMCSWLDIRKIPNYDIVAGEILFRKIFEMAPVALSIYSFGEEFRGREEDMYQSKIFQRHAKGVVRMLNEAINMLGPDLEPLTEELSNLGGRHVAYGVLPAHYPIVGEALLYTLETALGKEKWTTKVKQGWTAVYGFVSTAMIAGAEHRLKKAEIRRKRLEAKKNKKNMATSSNPANDHKSKGMTSRVSSSVKEKLSSIPGLLKRKNSMERPSILQDSNQVTKMIDNVLNISSGSCGVSDSSDDSTKCADPVTTEDEDDNDVNYFLVIDHVFMSWDKIRATIPDYEKVAGVLLFKKIFEIAPDAKALYSFYDKNDPSMQGESFYEHPAFLRHAVAVVRMLDAAVHMLGPDLATVAEVLEDLGARHTQYGVIPDHYPIVGEALLSTLEAALGDAWNDEVKLGWSTIYTFVSTSMIKGANKSQ